MWRSRNHLNKTDETLQPLLLTMQQMHDHAKMEKLREQQMNELTQAIRQQTAAITQLAESNKELVVTLAQLIISDVQPVEEEVDPAQGMGDARGGYVQRDGNTAQQWER